MDMSINVVQTHLVVRACRTARDLMVSQFVPRHRRAIKEQSIQMDIISDLIFTTGTC